MNRCRYLCLFEYGCSLSDQNLLQLRDFCFGTTFGLFTFQEKGLDLCINRLIVHQLRLLLKPINPFLAMKGLNILQQRRTLNVSISFSSFKSGTNTFLRLLEISPLGYL